MWGDGEQTRSFIYIDDCVTGIRKIMDCPDLDVPVNLGSSEMITMNGFAKLALDLCGKSNLPIRHIEGPVGVRGRNSDNTLIKEKLNWEPKVRLAEGMKETMRWIKCEIERELESGEVQDLSRYCSSRVVAQTTDSLDQLLVKTNEDKASL